ncbi:MAG: preprotein translocase subunit SecG [Bdellovibrionales bacterium]
MDSVLIVIHLIIAVALVVCILLQRTAQDGGGLMGGGGSGTMGGLFTARGSANLLTRMTAVLATLFVVMSLLLGFVASRSHSTQSAIDTIAPLTKTETVPAADAPAAVPEADAVPAVPLPKK